MIEFFTNIFGNTLLHALVGGIGLAIGLWFSPYLKKHILWVKGGIENGDGKLENKELQIVFFSILAAFMIISVAAWDVNYPEIAYIGVFGGAGLLYSINRMADAHVKVNNKNIKKKDDTEEDKESIS